jgi:hypothetical protein
VPKLPKMPKVDACHSLATQHSAKCRQLEFSKIIIHSNYLIPNYWLIKQIKIAKTLVAE